MSMIGSILIINNMDKTFKVIIECSNLDTAKYYAHMALSDDDINEEGNQDVLSIKIIK